MCKYQECSIAYIGEPSPPSIHGQPSSGKSFKLSITKQDDGGAPILEYIVKYRSVSTLFIIIVHSVFKFNCIKFALIHRYIRSKCILHTLLLNNVNSSHRNSNAIFPLLKFIIIYYRMFACFHKT